MCLTRRCDFVIRCKYKLQDERLQTNEMNKPSLTTEAPLREIYHHLFIQQYLFLVAVRNFRGKSGETISYHLLKQVQAHIC